MHFLLKSGHKSPQGMHAKDEYELLNYGNPAGYMPLRQSIAAYLQYVRAVKCNPEQVIIVTGSQQALDLGFTSVTKSRW